MGDPLCRRRRRRTHARTCSKQAVRKDPRRQISGQGRVRWRRRLQAVPWDRGSKSERGKFEAWFWVLGILRPPFGAARPSRDPLARGGYRPHLSTCWKSPSREFRSAGSAPPSDMEKPAPYLLFGASYQNSPGRVSRSSTISRRLAASR